MRPSLRLALVTFCAVGCAHRKPAPVAAPVAQPATPPKPTYAKTPPAPPVPSLPSLVSLFDGTTLEGWEGDPQIWSVKDGAIDGRAEKGGKLIYSKDDYDDFRLVLQTRLVSESNHLGVCFWGTRQPDFGYGQCILVIPPSGGMWDYHPGKKGPPKKNLLHPKFNPGEWHTAEVLAHFKTGEVRMAVDGIELLRYTDIDPTRLKKGPIGLQIHAGASEVQYKDMKVEVSPPEDRLITVTAQP